MKKSKQSKTASKKAQPVAKTRKLSEALLKEIVGGQLGVCQSRCTVCRSHCGAQSHCTP